MYTRVGQILCRSYALQVPHFAPAITHPSNHEKVQKYSDLPMYTRTRGYVMIYYLTILMLLMLYASTVKTLKNHAFANVYAHHPLGTCNIFFLFYLFFGSLSLKMAA